MSNPKIDKEKIKALLILVTTSVISLLAFGLEVTLLGLIIVSLPLIILWLIFFRLIKTWNKFGWIHNFELGVKKKRMISGLIYLIIGGFSLFVLSMLLKRLNFSI